MWGVSNIWGHPNIQEGCPNMGVSKNTGDQNIWRVFKHMGVSKHMGESLNMWGSPNIWGHLNKWGYPNIQGVSNLGCPNIKGAIQTNGRCPNICGVQTYRGYPHIWGVQTYGGIQTCRGACMPHMFGYHPVHTQHKESILYQTKGVSICPHTLGCPTYVWIPPICLDGGIQTCGGIQTYRRDVQIWGCPNIQGASKHMGCVQTYKGHPNIWGVQIYMG